MADFTNPSFEIADTELGVDITSVPASWDATGDAGTWASATFGPPLFYAEAFEALWGDNQDSLAEYEVTDLEVADFGLVPQTVYDGFETQWGDNEDALADLDDPGYCDPGAFDAAGDDTEDFEEEWVSRHAVADLRTITEAVPSGVPSRVHDVANDIKTKYNLHIADTTVHSVADVTNDLTSPDATDLASTITLTTEIWSDVWLHISDDTYHRSEVDPQLKPDGSLSLVTYLDCAAVLMLATVYVNLHFTWRSNSGPGYFDLFAETWATGTLSAVALPSDSNPEDFESQWAMPIGNENAITEFTAPDIEAGGFTITAGTQDFEDFDSTIQLGVITGGTGPGTYRAINKTHGCRIDFGGTLVSSELVVQVRFKTTGVWIDKDSVAAVPVTVQLDEGFRSVRINTTVWGSGSPTAYLGFREMET